MQPHLPAGHHVRDDVLLGRVLVDPVRPFVDCHHVATLLVDSTVSSLMKSKPSLIPRTNHNKFLASHLIDKGTPVQAGDLTPAHVRHLQVRVQQQVEREGDVLARVVHADVEVELLLAQDQSVRNAEAVKKKTRYKIFITTHAN